MATWWKIEFTGEPTEADLEHVAEQIREGFTSGQLIEHAPENKWYATDAEPRRNGTPGGDYQVADAWNVRLLNDAIPGAVVDVDYFAERSQQDQSEVPSEPAEYGVTSMISYTVCTDRDDPGGTETWAGIRYDYEADPLGYDDTEKADKAARFQAERWIADAAEFMQWDGKPFQS